ncbi:MAG: phosphonate degradation HD-domain oxygenase [Phycisphaerales bacterium]|jgi:phosphonate degradation associated HDIG domain protein
MPTTHTPTHPISQKVVALFKERGNSQYGHEAVTQAEHGLQAAMLGEQEGAPASLIAAALLHDVGHLLHDLPDDAPDQGIDDRHEILGQVWLVKHFPESVSEPVKLHVDAKRYLCTREPGYLAILSEPSIQSLALQGGPMSEAECQQFEANPHYKDAVRLRRWDDAAKIENLETPSIEYFAKYLDQTAL